jgi:hypothetical protein
MIQIDRETTKIWAIVNLARSEEWNETETNESG